MTTLTSHTEDEAAPAHEGSRAVAWWPRLRPVLLAVAFPVALLAIWHFSTEGRPTSLIPPPYDVWLEFEARDANGKTIGHSGWVEDNGRMNYYPSNERVRLRVALRSRRE